MKSNIFNLKQHDYPYDSFIAGWYIPENICDGLLEYYHANIKNVQDGVIGTKGNASTNIVKKSVKDSLDLSLSPNENSSEVQSYKSYLLACLNNYNEYYEYANSNYSHNLNVNFNLQRYKIGGGFKKWHFERSHPTSISRVLVFMTYLNNVEDGGTEFYYQKLKTKAKKGLTLIWPTDFTHTHRGIVSKTKEKYIVTGWFTLNLEEVSIKL